MQIGSRQEITEIIKKGADMKNILISILGLLALASCSSYYDYYKGGVRYTQEGSDCVYYAGEHGRKFSSDVRDMDKSKKIVYRDTLCASLFKKDTAGQPIRPERQILTTAAMETSCGSCGCNGCGMQAAPVLKRRYVIVTGM
jgi:hypothetical protein